ncbi:hypothetical protein ACLOJK_021867 [Asimina triloba]
MKRHSNTPYFHSPAEQGQKQRTREFEVIHQHHPTSEAAEREGAIIRQMSCCGNADDKDNEPPMRALSKLICLNNPDLVLFVREALVGNDAVDQLSKLNQNLADLSTAPNDRLIDGILLTKLDTIDVKVGSALSMVYISGAPVMSVGCGQSHTGLKKLNELYKAKIGARSVRFEIPGKGEFFGSGIEQGWPAMPIHVKASRLPLTEDSTTDEFSNNLTELPDNIVVSNPATPYKPGR